MAAAIVVQVGEEVSRHKSVGSAVRAIFNHGLPQHPMSETPMLEKEIQQTVEKLGSADFSVVRAGSCTTGCIAHECIIEQRKLDAAKLDAAKKG